MCSWSTSSLAVSTWHHIPHSSLALVRKKVKATNTKRNDDAPAMRIISNDQTHLCLCVRELLLSQLPAVNHHVAISKQCRASTANLLRLSRIPMLVRGSSNRVRRHTADTADSNNSKPQPVLVVGMADTAPEAGPVRPAGVSSNSNDKMPEGIRTNLSNRNRRGIISRGGSRSRSRSLPPRGLRAVTFPPHRLHRGRPQLLSSSRHSPPVYSTRPRR